MLQKAEGSAVVGAQGCGRLTLQATSDQRDIKTNASEREASNVCLFRHSKLACSVPEVAN
jgi:hypothetical protein